VGYINHAEKTFEFFPLNCTFSCSCNVRQKNFHSVKARRERSLIPFVSAPGYNTAAYYQLLVSSSTQVLDKELDKVREPKKARLMQPLHVPTPRVSIDRSPTKISVGDSCRQL